MFCKPLELIEDDELDHVISEVDIEKLVCEAEESTKGVEQDMEKNLKCFPEPSSDKYFQDVSKKKFLPSTRKKALWAGRIFEQWKCIQNFKLKQQGKLDLLITGNLVLLDIDDLNNVLSYFLIEIQKQNGDKCPWETLCKIVLSLQHYMTMNGCEIKLLEYPSLVKMWNTLNNRMKELSKDGIVCEYQQAKPISVKDEEHLWKSGLLGNDTPEKLVNTLLYLVGLHFALRACDEHKVLKVGYYSQL